MVVVYGCGSMVVYGLGLVLVYGLGAVANKRDGRWQERRIWCGGGYMVVVYGRGGGSGGSIWIWIGGGIWIRIGGAIWIRIRSGGGRWQGR